MALGNGRNGIPTRLRIWKSTHPVLALKLCEHSVRCGRGFRSRGDVKLAQTSPLFSSNNHGKPQRALCIIVKTLCEYS